MGKSSPGKRSGRHGIQFQHKTIIYPIFFLSGACGLAYEVIWVRILGLTLGNSIYAVSLVVAAFMAGLGLGSFLGGRFVEDKRNPLRVYAFLELGIGLFAVASPFLLESLKPIYVWVGQNLTSSPVMLNLFRFALAFVILLIPTMLMGATLPVLGKFHIRKSGEMGARIAWLYGINTLGAMAGCLSTGFIFIEALGVTGSIAAIAVINIAIASVILIFGRSQTIDLPVEIPNDKVKVQRSEGPYAEHILLAVLVGFALSGFASIAYEVIWTRALAHFVGHTTYAFTSILATFLFGIGLGSLLISAIADRSRHLLLILGVVEMAIGFLAILGMPLVGQLFYTMESAIGRRTWGTPIWVKFTYSFIVMLLPTLLMGMTFPLVSKIYVRLRKLGSLVGKIYAVNTIAGIVGSFAAAFLFIPLLGMQTSITIIAIINLLIGAVLTVLAPGLGRNRKIVVIAAGMLIVVAAAIIAPTRQPYSVIKRVKGGESQYYREGLNNTIEIVRRSDSAMELYIDGELNASTSTAGILVHRLLAQLPILLHPDPQSVFLVGLGSGMTAGAALSFDGVETIKCAEISKDIVNVGQRFSQWNHAIVESPRFEIEIEDGRISLLIDRREYDVMVTGIIHPKYNPGNAGLYSKDYYELCKSRLSDDGIMCQWIPLNALRDSEFKMIIATFQYVFPHTSLWFEELFGGDGNYNAVLIGSREPLKINFGEISKRLAEPDLTADLNSIGITDIYDLLNRFILSDEELKSYTGDPPLITDDKPRLEFGTVEIRDFTKILADLGGTKHIVWPHLVNLPVAPLEQGIIRDRLTRYDSMAKACIAGDVYHWENKLREYIAQYHKAAEIAPDNQAIQTELAGILRLIPGAQASNPLERARAHVAEGNIADAISIYEQMVNTEPDRIDLRSDLGLLYLKSGKIDLAIKQFQNIIQSDPGNLDIGNNLGIAYMQKGMYVEAERQFLEILKSDSQHVQSLVNLGLTYARTGRKDRAIGMLEKAQAIQPDNANISKVLEQVRR